MTTPASNRSDAEEPQPHSCEHCSADAHADAPDVTEAAAKNLAMAARRLAPRIALGVLGAGLAAVFAQRGGFELVPVVLLWAGGAAAWFIGAWLGTLLGVVLTRRGARAQIALGQVLAAALAPLLALGLALTLLPLQQAPAEGTAVPAILAPRIDIPIDALWPGGAAAAFGWFLAAALGELLSVRALRSRIDQQTNIGARARQEAEALTPASVQRGELLALALAAGFGAMVIALTWIPWLAAVLVPLCAAGAAWLVLRRARSAGV